MSCSQVSPKTNLVTAPCGLKPSHVPNSFPTVSTIVAATVRPGRCSLGPRCPGLCPGALSRSQTRALPHLLADEQHRGPEKFRKWPEVTRMPRGRTGVWTQRPSRFRTPYSWPLRQPDCLAHRRLTAAPRHPHPELHPAPQHAQHASWPASHWSQTSRPLGRFPQRPLTPGWPSPQQPRDSLWDVQRIVWHITVGASPHQTKRLGSEHPSYFAAQSPVRSSAAASKQVHKDG